MKPMRSPRLSTPRTPLAVLVATCLITSSGLAAAGTLNGTAGTVAAGDAVETLTLTNGAELTIDGGATDWVKSTSSTVIMNGGEIHSPTNAPALLLENSHAEIVGARIIGSSPNAGNGGRALMVDNVWLDPQGSTANVRDSYLSGTDAGASVSNYAVLNVSNSEVRGTATWGAALRSYGGLASFSNGSVLFGQREGVHFGARRGPNEDSTFILDNSSLQSVDGSALMLNYDAIAHITLRNGATVDAGNGILLDVRDSALANLVLDGVSVAGDIIANRPGNANVALNNAELSARMTNAGTVALAGNSVWHMTGDSSIGALDVAAGSLVSLGDGSSFNTLTVSGDVSGSGGTLRFNSVLGDDGSARDFLHVLGDTSGQLNVAVNNVGGAGAHTDQGIRLVQVDGASHGQFDLAGRAVGGQYEYFLFKGSRADPNDGHWYLRTELPTTPDPCELDPTGPGCGVVIPDPCDIDPGLPQCTPLPVLRPEAGAYLANQAAAIGLFQHRLHDRNGEPAFAGERRGAWARVSRNQADYGVIGNQLQVDSDSSVLQIGSDLLSVERNGQARVGVMLASGQANNQVRSALTGYTAKGKVRGTALGVYGTWTQHSDQAGGAYVDAWLQHGRYRNRVEGEGLQAERYQARSNAASLEAGYAWPLRSSAASALYLEPQLQIGWTGYNSDQHTERNGTVVATDQAGGLATRVGVRLYGHATAAGNRVQPFLAANWLRDGGDNSVRFDGERLQGGVPQNRYELKAGAQLRLGANWAAWGDMGLQRGDGGYRNVAGQIGLRRSW